VQYFLPVRIRIHILSFLQSPHLTPSICLDVWAQLRFMLQYSFPIATHTRWVIYFSAHQQPKAILTEWGAWYSSRIPKVRFLLSLRRLTCTTDMVELYRRCLANQLVFFLLENSGEKHIDKGSAPWSPVRERDIYKGYRIVLHASTDQYDLPNYRPEVCQCEIDDYYIANDVCYWETDGKIRPAHKDDPKKLLTLVSAQKIAEEPSFQMGALYQLFWTTDDLD
jgi:hypothetical protein